MLRTVPSALKRVQTARRPAYFCLAYCTSWIASSRPNMVSAHPSCLALSLHGHAMTTFPVPELRIVIVFFSICSKFPEYPPTLGGGNDGTPGLDDSSRLGHVCRGPYVLMLARLPR